MYYYRVALLNSALAPLIYASDRVIDSFVQVKVPLKGKIKKGVIIEQTQKPSFSTQKIQEVLLFSYLPYQQTLAKFIASYYVTSLSEALSIFTPYKKTTKSSLSYTNKVGITLSTKQQEALKFLQTHLISLLFGDTGSGKTEIYMKFFESFLLANKQVLLLVPEISLTPQMQKRLEHYFGDVVVMWHSKLTKKQKDIALEKIYSKQARVIAGARSALFLPFEDLGAIVIDEEHDESYKSQTKPRYNARDVAIYLAKQKQIPIVLGSATPSVSSFYHYPTFRLKESFFQAKKQYIFELSIEALTPTLLEYIRKNLEKKEQTIIFVPTRANFKYLQCRECGEDFSCAFCHVGMSIHKKLNGLKCHYCGYMQPIPSKCPSCGKDTLVSSRLGSAEIVEELKKVFPQAKIAQFDRDTITTQKKLTTILEQFNNKTIDILVGTQMITKGHDYHDVTLAIVLGMDNMLGLGDFRAREKALSTLIQIAGRSGRKKDAIVYIQTFHQDFFEQYLQQYELFLEEELEFRKELYPPFMRLARLLFTHKNAQKAKEQMESVLAILQQYSKIQIMGYGECSIAKIANKYRYEILLRAKKATDLIKVLHQCYQTGIIIDVDPLEFS